MKKAIPPLKLDQANRGKLQQLAGLAAEYQRVVPADGDWLIAPTARRPDKYAPLPEAAVSTARSARGPRCAWHQAWGLVRSW